MNTIAPEKTGNTEKKDPCAVARAWLDRRPLFLDTETTGLDETAEIVQIAVLDHRGEALLDCLVKPTRPIPPEATAVHGITDDDVAGAAPFSLLVPVLAHLLRGRPVVIYNAEYDLRLLQQSAGAHGHYLGFLEGKERLDSQCAMLLYAWFYGEPGRYGDWRWQKLDKAAAQCGLEWPAAAHRARADAEMCRRILLHMAGQSAQAGPSAQATHAVVTTVTARVDG